MEKLEYATVLHAQSDSSGDDYRSGIYRYNGTQWINCIPYYHNGSEWVKCRAWRYDGSQWKK